LRIADERAVGSLHLERLDVGLLVQDAHVPALAIVERQSRRLDPRGDADLRPGPERSLGLCPRDDATEGLRRRLVEELARTARIEARQDALDLDQREAGPGLVRDVLPRGSFLPPTLGRQTRGVAHGYLARAM